MKFIQGQRGLVQKRNRKLRAFPVPSYDCGSEQKKIQKNPKFLQNTGKFAIGDYQNVWYNAARTGGVDGSYPIST